MLVFFLLISLYNSILVPKIKGMNEAIIDYISKCCDIMGVKMSDILSDSRSGGIPLPKQIIYKLLRDKKLSSGKIGEFFGRTPSAILIGEKRINDLIEVEDEYVTDVFRKLIRANLW